MKVLGEICVVNECRNLSISRGLCSNHYQKARASGNLNQYPRRVWYQAKASTQVHAINRTINQYRPAAKVRGIEWSLVAQDIENIIFQPCFYCNTEGDRRIGNVLFVGIDRIDNTLGYVTNNCVPCCKICNIAKSDLSSQDWDQWRQRMAIAWLSENEWVVREIA